MKILKKHGQINTDDLPNDSRSLLRTPKSSVSKIITVNLGKYFHFGLESGLLQHAPPSLNEIKVAIGIDGLPLSKSSSSQFWPILAYVIEPFPKQVFSVGIYHGYEKPKDSDMFLAKFIEEAKHLVSNGIQINGITKKVIISVFCCDAPARAFILKIKSHSGFFSCARCTVEGEYYKNRVCFPYSEDWND